MSICDVLSYILFRIQKAITSGVISVASDLLARALAKKPLKSSTAINELTIGLVIR